jgi:hypothetical protein
MDFVALGDALASAWTLAKEMGKGGGGSTEEPTVCIVMVPIGVGVLAIVAQRLRRAILSVAWRKGGRSGHGLTTVSERKVQTA